MNNINLVGRLVRDPERKTTTSGKEFATFTIAVKKRIKPTNPDERDADFFNVKVWDKTAAYVIGFLVKGSQVSISGRMESRKYMDKEGQSREAWEVNASEVNGLDRKPEGSPNTAATTAPPAETEYDPFAED